MKTEEEYNTRDGRMERGGEEETRREGVRDQDEEGEEG